MPENEVDNINCYTTKEKIFFAAAKLFAKNGYANVSTRDIAAEVGIRVSSIYNHYASKEEILDGLLNLYQEFQNGVKETVNNIDVTQPIDKILNDLNIVYDAEQAELMGWIGKIVLAEMFYREKAGSIIFDHILTRGVENYGLLLRKMEALGKIKGDNHFIYAELMTRVSLTYLMQSVYNPALNSYEGRPAIDDMFRFILKTALPEPSDACDSD